MPEITDVLGKQNPEEQPINPEELDKLKSGMGLPSEEDDGEGNPLEKMDEISKAKQTKKSSGDKSLDSDIINEMLMTGDNSEGMFIPDEKKEKDGEPKLHEDEDESMKKKLDGKVQPSEKYIRNFKNDMLKHPTEYKIQTPKGEMTVAEAIQKGYNPITKRFEKNHDQKLIKEKQLSKVNDADKAALEKLTDPSSAQVAPADASKYGLKADSPMIKKPMGMEGEQSPMPPGAEGQAQIHGGQAPAQGGQPDLSALLGGGM